MTKKHFISLADAIRKNVSISSDPKTVDHFLDVLADWCASQNSNFMRQRWLGYIKGENGPSGGKRK